MVRRPGQPPEPPRRPGQPKPIPGRGRQLQRPKGAKPTAVGGRPGAVVNSAQSVPSKEATEPIKGAENYQKLIFDADRFFEEKKFNTAFKIYREALPLAPAGNAHCLKQLCRCYRKKARKALRNEDFQKAFDLLTEMMQLERVKAHLQAKDFQVKAEAALELVLLDEAEAALSQALDLEPDPGDEILGLQKRLKTERLHNELRGMS